MKPTGLSLTNNRTGASIHSATNGSWFRRIGRSARGKVRSRRFRRAERPQYDPTCYLCPGNERAGGVRNPKYASTFVFENDFAALKKDAPRGRLDVQDKGLLVAEGEPGICRVMCFSPRHDLTLASMNVAGNRRSGPDLDFAIRGTGCGSRNQSRADFRKPRRNDGREQSSSALPDLGDGIGSRAAGARTRCASEYVSRRAPILPALRLRRAGANPGDRVVCATTALSRWCLSGRYGRLRSCCAAAGISGTFPEFSGD